MTRPFVFYILFILFSYANAQPVRIKCLFPKNLPLKNIEVKTYKELITYTDTTLATAAINGDSAYFQLDLKETRMLFFPYGRQKVKFFAMPGKEYTVKFPAYAPKTRADSVNPYFEPVEIWAGTQVSDTLNRKIIEFNEEYSAYLDLYFYTIYRQGYHAKADTFINSMKKKYSDCKIPFFENYMKYKLAFLEFVSKKRDIRKITWEYYRHKKPDYFNPAYMDLFNEMYKYFFNLYAQTPEGKEIVYAVTRGKSPALIKESLSKRYELAGDDTLMELVALKGLYDASFASTVGAFDKLPYKQVIITLDSIAMLTPVPVHRTIAQDIKAKIKATFFSFKDTFKILTFRTLDGDKFVFDNFKGKFAYVGLCDIKGLPCLEQFPVANRFAGHYANVLDVYYIFPPDQKDEVKKYFAKNKLKALKPLFFEKTADIKRLDVPVFPRYVLINPYGAILNETAPVPTENFNSYFVSILRKQN